MARRFQQPKPEVWRMELTQIQTLKAAEWMAAQVHQWVTETVHQQITERPVHSPIEATFLAWWLAIDRLESVRDSIPEGLELAPQIEITLPSGKVRRPDFVVWPGDPDSVFNAAAYGLRFPNLAVELDGHEFHERTKEQVIERDQRDRDFQNAGWRLFHFSGSELVKDPERCVREVREVAVDALSRLHISMEHQRLHLELARSDAEASTPSQESES